MSFIEEVFIVFSLLLLICFGIIPIFLVVWDSIERKKKNED